MILGVDHVALSCSDVARSAACLQEVGYNAKFVQPSLENHPAKRPFLRTYDARHAMAYCQVDGGVSIELTYHSRPLAGGMSPYQVLLDATGFDAEPEALDSVPDAWGEAWREGLSCARPAPAVLRAFEAQGWRYAADEEATRRPGAVQAVMAPVADVARSVRFWTEGLGCREVARGGSWVHVAFQAPLPAWSLDVILAAPGAERPGCLDDAGFPCLALISSRIGDDLAQAVAAGGQEATAPFTIEVGGAALEIALLRGPGGELVELIQFRRG